MLILAMIRHHTSITTINLLGPFFILFPKDEDNVIDFVRQDLNVTNMTKIWGEWGRKNIRC